MQSGKQKSGAWKETAAELAKNRSAIEKLAHSGDARKLMELLGRQGGVEEAAGEASGGDPSRLLKMMDRLMEDPEGARLMGRLRDEAHKAGLN